MPIVPIIAPGSMAVKPVVNGPADTIARIPALNVSRSQETTLDATPDFTVYLIEINGVGYVGASS
jgi:hypothetical protein